MDDYKKYYGVAFFCIFAFVLFLLSYNTVAPKVQKYIENKDKIVAKENEYKKEQAKLKVVQKKIKSIKDSIVSSQKKIYSPVESDLGSETLFFTLYNDVIEMIHANKIKIKAIDYKYNPETDKFVQFGKDIYFVCDVDMELVSNYINLGKLIQDIYQYPYYIKINNIEVTPYAKDKKILLTNISLRLYAHTEPDVTSDVQLDPQIMDDAETPLPQ